MFSMVWWDICVLREISVSGSSALVLCEDRLGSVICRLDVDWLVWFKQKQPQVDVRIFS